MVSPAWRESTPKLTGKYCLKVETLKDGVFSSKQFIVVYVEEKYYMYRWFERDEPPWNEDLHYQNPWIFRWRKANLEDILNINPELLKGNKQ